MRAQDLARLPFRLEEIKLCDNGGCGKSATKICAGCRCHYYCSRECQVLHWKKRGREGHKEDCNHVKQIIKTAEKKRNQPEQVNDCVTKEERDYQAGGDDEAGGDGVECPICSDMFPPSSMERLENCVHKFCAPCIHKHQVSLAAPGVALEDDYRSISKTFPCPLCRIDGPCVQTSITTRGAELWSHTGKTLERGDLARGAKLRDVALAVLNKGISIETMSCTFCGDKGEHEHVSFHGLTALLLKMTVLVYSYKAHGSLSPAHSQDLRQTAHLARDLLGGEDPRVVNPEDPCGSPPTINIMQTTLRFLGNVGAAEAFMAADDVPCAVISYQRALFLYHQCEVCQFGFWQHGIGFAQAMYLTGEIETAISLCDQAMGLSNYPKGMGRFYENVGKFKVLSLFKQGKVKEARQALQLGILHEAPWNKDHLEGLLSLYQSMFGADVKSAAAKAAAESAAESAARAPLMYEMAYRDVDFDAYEWYSSGY